MFLESSRYFNQNQVDFITKDDRRSIRVLSLRRLSYITGTPRILESSDRLDTLAQQQYNNPTMFWHIADANTELWANDLVEKTDKVKIVMVPDS